MGGLPSRGRRLRPRCLGAVGRRDCPRSLRALARVLPHAHRAAVRQRDARAGGRPVARRRRIRVHVRRREGPAALYRTRAPARLGRAAAVLPRAAEHAGLDGHARRARVPGHRHPREPLPCDAAADDHAGRGPRDRRALGGHRRA